MPLSTEQVRHIAHLARLALTDEEVSLYAEQVSEILDYAQRLQALDTGAIPPTATVVPQRGVMREDCPTPSLSQAEALANAHEVDGGHFVVRAILGES